MGGLSTHHRLCNVLPRSKYLLQYTVLMVSLLESWLGYHCQHVHLYEDDWHYLEGSRCEGKMRLDMAADEVLELTFEQTDRVRSNYRWRTNNFRK